MQLLVTHIKNLKYIVTGLAFVVFSWFQQLEQQSTKIVPISETQAFLVLTLALDHCHIQSANVHPVINYHTHKQCLPNNS
jgi:hypothetical protein